MTSIDAYYLATDRFLRHVSKLYNPKEAMKLFPDMPKAKTITDVQSDLKYDFLYNRAPIKIKLSSFLYACDALEARYLHLRKGGPSLSAELSELWSLYEQAKATYIGYSRKNLDVFLHRGW